jgi:hypothetical protein
MSLKRREFIKSVGIGFASLILTQCTRFTIDNDPIKDDLRECWLKLPWLAEQTRADMEQGEEDRMRLLMDHRAALNRLIGRGEITDPVADQLQVAFEEAAFHVWRLNSGMTCYMPMPGPDYTPTSSDQLATQAKILLELAESSNLDLDTVEQAQAAIQRDIAFLNLPEGDLEALYGELMAAAGETRNYPDFDDLELEAPAEAIAAANLLIEVLLDIRPGIEGNP